MTRSAFLRSLLLLAASPAVLAEAAPVAQPPIKAGFFNDLNFVIPDYIPELYEKYGVHDFHEELRKYATGNGLEGHRVRIHWHEKPSHNG